MQKIIIAYLCLVLGPSSLVAQGYNEWKEVKNKKNIVVFERNIEDSKLKAFKAHTTVHSRIDKVVELITDFDNYSEWMKGCKESYSLDYQNSDTTLYCYLLYDVPWPLPDRDNISEMKIHRINNSEVNIHFISIPDHLPTSDGMFRIRKAEGKWKLKEIDSTTKISYEATMDLGKDLPPYIQNKAMASTTYSLMEGLIKFASL